MLRYVLMLISVAFIGDLGMNSFSFAWPLRRRRTRISAWPKTGCSLPYISSLCFAPHSLHLQTTLCICLFLFFQKMPHFALSTSPPDTSGGTLSRTGARLPRLPCAWFSPLTLRPELLRGAQGLGPSCLPLALPRRLRRTSSRNRPPLSNG